MQQVTDLYSFSHIGKRQENQDRYIALEDVDSNTRLIVIADGLGGHTGGSLAAETVIESAIQLWQQSLPVHQPKDFLRKLVSYAHENVCSAQNTANSDAQSTLAALFLSESASYSVHVGDSRVYQFDKQQLLKRTIDHSMAQLLALSGKITDDEIAEHPDKSKLFSSVGGSRPPKIEIESYPLTNCSFVVCTDGFWELFTLTEMPMIFSEIDSQLNLAQLITVKSANSVNQDNITAIMVRVREYASNTAVANTSSTIEAEGQSKSNFIGKGSNALKKIEKNILFLVLGSGLIAVSILFFLNDDDQLQRLPVQGFHAGTPGISESDQDNGGAPTIEKLVSDNRSATGTKPATLQEVLFNQRASGERVNKEQIPDNTGAVDNIKDQSSIAPDATDIPTQRRKVNIAVTDVNDTVRMTEHYLRENGDLSERDDLIVTSINKSLGVSRIVKMQQRHKGVPVYGAETISIINDDRLQQINSKSIGNVYVEVIPAVTLENAVNFVERELQNEVTLIQDGELVILKVDEIYNLTWLMNLTLGNDEPYVVFVDAQKAEILKRVSLTMQ